VNSESSRCAIDLHIEFFHIVRMDTANANRKWQSHFDKPLILVLFGTLGRRYVMAFGAPRKIKFDKLTRGKRAPSGCGRCHD
jgi:hypothetical protein